ncbi:aromatic ring-hydroxylating dioxygenase subunit alpha [Croceicoccus gelatinilyticus]|uniref:aromatic ring-hydroxylating dioxygenase subunit alpha n=1 Tax=Croceicoccus gelatinilyticus TaxID=2835536 RepID=UPI001BCC8B6D|nr:aromatic ring-hydroxylating dioxygenase subunit alpha [Croceicoccus gelatinilyticus]MBS7668705.1 Rieske 2Fe-2S domain-containing protein [Croceicoccus gelatinilyticus]
MTTMMKNSWYCAGWTTDVTNTPLHRKIMGQDIVLFRDSHGAVQALSDRCPHRFAPLHKGKVKGDAIECPYHGLRFDGTGTCVLNPHGSGQVPPGHHTDSFRVEERNGTIWIWIGDPDKANTDGILDTSFLVEKDMFASRTEHHSIEGNYMLVVDNLLDLTHAQFLHPETVFGKSAAERWSVSLTGKPGESDEVPLQEVWFEETETSLTAHQMMRQKPQPPLWDPIVDYGLADLHSWITWYAPSNLDLRLDLTRAGQDEKPARMIVVHLITPIDEHSCHYFVAIGWDTNIEDEEAADRVIGIVRQTLVDEDGPMIELCQTYMDGETDLFALKPLLLQTDGVAIKARRRMSKLLEMQT